MLLLNLIQVTESISGSVVPLAMFMFLNKPSKVVQTRTASHLASRSLLKHRHVEPIQNFYCGDIYRGLWTDGKTRNIARLEGDLTDLGRCWTSHILLHAEVVDVEAAEGETEIYGAAQS